MTIGLNMMFLVPPVCLRARFSAIWQCKVATGVISLVQIGKRSLSLNAWMAEWMLYICSRAERREESRTSLYIIQPSPTGEILSWKWRTPCGWSSSSSIFHRWSLESLNFLGVVKRTECDDYVCRILTLSPLNIQFIRIMVGCDARLIAPERKKAVILESD